MGFESKARGNRAKTANRADAVPGFRADLGSRLLSVIEMFPSKRAASMVAEVTVEQLGNYTNGHAKPPLEVVGRLAAWGKISLDWVWTGRGERSLIERNAKNEAARAVDDKLMIATIQAIEELFTERKWSLPPAKKAELVVLVYLEVQETKIVDVRRIERFFKLAS